MRLPEKELEPVLKALNLPDNEAGPAKDVVPLTSKSPEMRRSLADLI